MKVEVGQKCDEWYWWSMRCVCWSAATIVRWPGIAGRAAAITFELADNMIQQQRPLLWKLLKFKCSTRWTVGGHVRRHGWSDLGGRDLAKRRATIVRWPGIAGRAAAITFEFADNMKQQQRLLWKLLKFKCWIRWTVGGYVRRDAVMALVESASDGAARRFGFRRV